MSYMNTFNDRRGHSRQAMPRRSGYPRYGMENPTREQDMSELYRYSERGVSTRHIIPPKVVRWGRRSTGLTIGDVAFFALAIATAALLVYTTACGDWIEVLGW